MKTSEKFQKEKKNPMFCRRNITNGCIFVNIVKKITGENNVNKVQTMTNNAHTPMNLLANE